MPGRSSSFSGHMRPFHEYPKISIDELQTELSSVVKLLYDSMGEYSKVLGDYERDHIAAYYESPDDSHAARTRWADRQTQSLHEDVIIFEQNIAAYRVLHDYITNLIQWRING